MLLNDDVLLHIFQFLSYRSLKKIELLDKRYNKIIRKNDLLEKSKLHGFPRLDGEHATFDILKDYSYILTEEDIKNCYDDNFYITDAIIQKVLDKSDEINIIRGDVVLMKGFDNFIGSYKNDGEYIFDGGLLINISTMGDDEKIQLLENLFGDIELSYDYWFL